jgi:NAD(P)H-dependent FMN reductase
MTDTSPLALQIIIGSTRPQRAGEPVAHWVFERASQRGNLTVELLDLREIALPLLDEPRQPSEGHYVHAHTQRWAAMIAPSDAVIFVVPEYNHSFNAATKNAIDYLYAEWRYKAVGVVCYGGGARGTRAAQHLKPVLSALKMIHAGDVAVGLTETVREGDFSPTPANARALESLLDEVTRLSPHLRELRASSSARH